jgi:hypothetical protein
MTRAATTRLDSTSRAATMERGRAGETIAGRIEIVPVYGPVFSIAFPRPSELAAGMIRTGLRYAMTTFLRAGAMRVVHSIAE